MELLFNTIMLEVNRWTPEHELTRPLADLLAPLKERGFDALELWQYHISALSSEEVESLARKFRELEMRAPVLGAYPAFHLKGTEEEENQELLDRLIDAANRLGVATFKIFPGRLGSAEIEPEVWDRSVHRIADLASRLAEKGMDLTMETHAHTLCDSVKSTQRLLSELDTFDNVGLCFQPYIEQDTDQAIAAYDLLQPAVRHIHLQNRQRSDGSTTLLEEGDWIDYTRFLSHVRKSGFDGLLCIEFTAGLFPPEGEDFDPQTVIDNAAKDRAFVLEIWRAAS